MADAERVAELLVAVSAALGTEEQMWSSAICERLAQAHPSRYAGWDQTALRKALRGLGVSTGQTWWTTPDGKASNRNGVTREQIADELNAARSPQP